jgi:hypothetical protein
VTTIASPAFVRQQRFDGGLGSLLHEHDHRGRREQAAAAHVTGQQLVVDHAFGARVQPGLERIEVSSHHVHCPG